MSKTKKVTPSIQDTEKAYKEGLEDNLRKRKRKRIILRIVLLMLILLLVLVIILALSLTSCTKVEKELALDMSVSSYGVENGHAEQLGNTKKYRYERGTETDGVQNIEYPPFNLDVGVYFRLDYKIHNLSEITYSYVIDLTKLEIFNCEVTYFTNLTDEEEVFPESNILRLAHNKDFEFSIVIKVKDYDISTANCKGVISFTIEIM